MNEAPLLLPTPGAADRFPSCPMVCAALSLTQSFVGSLVYWLEVFTRKAFSISVLHLLILLVYNQPYCKQTVSCVNWKVEVYVGKLRESLGLRDEFFDRQS